MVERLDLAISRATSYASFLRRSGGRTTTPRSAPPPSPSSFRARLRKNDPPEVKMAGWVKSAQNFQRAMPVELQGQWPAPTIPPHAGILCYNCSQRGQWSGLCRNSRVDPTKISVEVFKTSGKE